MLVSTKVDHRAFFAGLRAVVVDEVHAFAGDDRGWHLLAVLERLDQLAGRPLQRIGLSATVGNPDELLALAAGLRRGHAAGARGRAGRRRPAPAAPPGDIELDYVGSRRQRRHGDRRAAPRREAAGLLRRPGSRSRSSAQRCASAASRRSSRTPRCRPTSGAGPSRRSPRPATASSSPPPPSNSASTSATSTGSSRSTRPRTVASFLQRLGRTGRRAGTTRNCLFLALDRRRAAAGRRAAAALGRGLRRAGHRAARAAAHRRPADPRALPAGAPGRRPTSGREWWNGLAPFDRSRRADRCATWSTRATSTRDGGMLFIGPEAEQRFGRRHFMDLTAVFTAPPEFTVLARAQRDRPDRPEPADREGRGPAAAAARRAELAGHLHRLDAPPLLRRAGRRRRQGPLDGSGARRALVRTDPGDARRAARRRPAGQAHPPRHATARRAPRRTRSRARAPGGTVIIRVRRRATCAGGPGPATAPTPPCRHPRRPRRPGAALRRPATSGSARTSPPTEWRDGHRGRGERLCLPEVDEKAL